MENPSYSALSLPHIRTSNPSSLLKISLAHSLGLPLLNPKGKITKENPKLVES